MSRKMFQYLFVAVFSVFVLSGCSVWKKDEPAVEAVETVETKVEQKAPRVQVKGPETDEAISDTPTPVEKIYRDAVASLNKDKFVEAAKLFDEVERQYPYSQWATRAQLMASYAHYRNLRYDESVLALDRFIQLHPGDKNIVYAYYLRALCYYEQISDVRRDQKMTKLALENLNQVVKRYPSSKYARDAQLKMDLTLDHLAGKEMEIGRYYLNHKQYQAAVNRFQRVTEEYQTTTHVPEALHRLVETYLALGIPVEAKKSAAVLGHNFPNSIWYKDSYALLKGDFPTTSLKDGQDDRSIYEKTIGRIF